MLNLIPIAYYQDSYSISEDGHVFDRKTGEFKNQNTDQDGYKIITLIDHLGGKRTHRVHIIVAKHFIPNPYECTQVNHIDGNKANNHYTNLEWVTPKQNIQHALETGLREGYVPIEAIKKAYNMVMDEDKFISEVAKDLGLVYSTLHRKLKNYAKSIGEDELFKKRMIENNVRARSKGFQQKRLGSS